MISEVAPGSVESLSKEFIELYNTSSQQVDISGWTIDYKSATGKTWSKRASFNQDTSLAPKSALVVSTEAEAEYRLVSGMAQTGGNIRLRDSSGQVIDQVAWGDGDSPEGSSVSAPAIGQSIVRNATEAQDNLIDTDNNQDDFVLQAVQTPGKIGQTTELEDNDSSVTPPATNDTGQIFLSELLPDPQSPQSDTQDEYIELYNQGDAPVSLDGWSLRDKTNHVYRITNTVIGPKEFLVLKSAVTKISLNNDGDEIFLIDPTGSVVDNSPNYGTARPGLTWGLSDDVWSWLAEPTPGASNTGALPPKTSDTASSTKKATHKSSSVPAKKSKTAKKQRAASKLAAAQSTKTQPYTEPDLGRNSGIWSWLLIGLGAGTIGYGIYAYKPEITHTIHQLRTKLGNR